MRDFSKKKKKRTAKKYRKKIGRKENLVDLLRKSIKLSFVATVFSLLFAVLYGCWTLFMTSPYFGFSEVTIAGNKKVTGREITKVAGIADGTNSISFDMNDAGRRIEEIPWISKVSMERRFPNFLKISLVERIPVAMINLGEIYYLDDEGYIFAAADEEIGWDFPVLTGLDKERLMDGDVKTFALLDEGMELLRVLKDREGELSWNSISEMVLDYEDGITLFTVGGGTPVQLGSGMFVDKLMRAERVLEDLKKKRIRPKRIEADYNDRVLVKVSI